MTRALRAAGGPNGFSARFNGPLRLVLIYNSDPFEENIGGTRRYMRFLLRGALRAGGEVKFVGVRMGARNNSSSKVQFIPLLAADSLTASRRWWLYLLVSLVRAPLFRLEPDEVIHAGRLIYLLPYVIWYPKNPKVCTSDMPQAMALRSYPTFLFRFLSVIYACVERFIMKRIDAVIAAPHVLKDYYLAHYPELRGKFQFDIDAATGVDTTIFRPRDKMSVRQELGLALDEKIVLFVGRLHPIKGLGFLIDSFAEYAKLQPKSSFLIVGEDWANGYFQQYARRHVQCDIRFLGEKRGENLAKLHNAADVLLLGSEHEGNPTVVREALCSGTPVVSTDVGDVRALLGGQPAGAVVGKEPAAFAKAIADITAPDWRRVQQRCATIAERVSEDAVFGQVYGLYLRLLEARSLG